MNIGAAAEQSGLPAKTIRYYEDIGLISPARRNNGYRDYGEDDVHKLRFLHRARGLGFSIEDCRQLLSLYEDRSRASADVKSLALARITDIEAKMAELSAMRQTLKRLVSACHGDNRPDCPILDDIASG
ncbi:Copper export regulator [Hartmannibacter diazotrophicus]|uniref:Copper export regulator n=1 Tax=Hartmannibacter diazotrophicus TaxID=1482074 RepID=A0A2C9D711_9HYPH|nr:Cu(I)-responsive transcriptional regulator [Hartmannibacter diazotrophicus]SON56102.1 Copper export regulator [Hartmannibacter diazotrophicus]